MAIDIKTITFRGVNCYLLKKDGNCILIDTGFADKRKEILIFIEKENIERDQLKIIIVTHGDSDHSGNANYFRKLFGIKIIMNQLEIEAVKSGYSAYSRDIKNDISGILIKLILLLVKLGEKDRFIPDIILNEEIDISQYGIEAKIINLPGHTKGSIGIYTNEGDLFCGDLLMNKNGKVQPGIGINNRGEFLESITKIKNMNLRNIYPGHGKPFNLEELKEMKI